MVSSKKKDIQFAKQFMEQKHWTSRVSSWAPCIVQNKQINGMLLVKSELVSLISIHIDSVACP